MLRTISESKWRPYFRLIDKPNPDTDYGLFEVGYLDQHGSVIIVGNRVDVLLLTPPPYSSVGVSKIGFERKEGCPRTTVYAVGCNEHARWTDVASTAELVWQPHPVQIVESEYQVQVISDQPSTGM
jgi:hypothetical protein